jgi:hypothetical protein
MGIYAETIHPWIADPSKLEEQRALRRALDQTASARVGGITRLVVAGFRFDEDQ